MRDKLKTIGAESDTFTIEIRPTSKCNYNCYYCTDLHINRNPITLLSTNNINKLILSAKRHTKKKIHIFFCGGEPTIYPDLVGLINKISTHIDSNDVITVQSNLYKSIEWYIDFHKQLKCVDQFVFNGSYHNTQNVKLYDYIKKCVLLKSKGILGMVSFGYNKKNDVNSEYEEACKYIGLKHCEIVPLINASVDQDPKKGNGTCDEIDYVYSTEDMDEYKDKGHFFNKEIPYELTTGEKKYTSRGQLWLKRDNNFIGSLCSIPKYKIYIDWDGSCYRCFNEQFSPLSPIFNINDTNINYDEYFENIKCMRCPFTTCFFDIEYKKVFSEDSGQVEEVKISKYFNTNEYRSKR